MQAITTSRRLDSAIRSTLLTSDRPPGEEEQIDTFPPHYISARPASTIHPMHRPSPKKVKLSSPAPSPSPSHAPTCHDGSLRFSSSPLSSLPPSPVSTCSPERGVMELMLLSNEELVQRSVEPYPLRSKPNQSFSDPVDEILNPSSLEMVQDHLITRRYPIPKCGSDVVYRYVPFIPASAPLPHQLVNHLSSSKPYIPTHRLIKGKETDVIIYTHDDLKKPKKPITEREKVTKEKKPTKLALRAAINFSIDKSDWVQPDPLVMINGKPPIWCMGRQELCESLPYFRSYQGGHADLAGRCLGYLLDGFPSSLDTCSGSGRVIISHGGGCADVKETSKLVKDQERGNSRMEALFNCWETKTPVALLAGKNYNFFPWLKEQDIRYAVLGHYFVTDIWPTREIVETKNSNGETESMEMFVRFKIRFEWVPSQGLPWFSQIIGGDTLDLSQSNLGLDPSTGVTPTSTFSCSICDKAFARIYQESVSCLNETCPNFFRIDGFLANASSLHHLLSLLTITPLSISSTWSPLVPQQLIPVTLASLRLPTASTFVPAYSRAAWKGFNCTLCGRLSSRSDWNAFICVGCGDRVVSTSHVYAALELAGEVKLLQREEPKMGKKTVGEGKWREVGGGWKGWTFELPKGGKVHQFWNEEEEELTRVDELLEEYQGVETGGLFKRSRMGVHRLPGQLLCSQFSFNCGKHYNHVAKVTTVPWSESPPCVKTARTLLISTVQRIIVDPNQALFNEVMSVAYMQEQKMNFHDDGEIGLGPVVATLSLGASAKMTFREKVKKKKSSTAAATASTSTSTSTSTSSTGETKRRNGELALTLKLCHGDVLIMEGREVQLHYEHAVQADGLLRFAATARYLGEDHR